MTGNNANEHTKEPQDAKHDFKKTAFRGMAWLGVTSAAQAPLVPETVG